MKEAPFHRRGLGACVTVLKTILGWVCCLALTAAADPGRRPFLVMGADQGLTAGAVICMAQDRDGFIWTGSENGLIRYEGGQCRQWSTEDGLPSTSVARLLAAPDGGIWASTMRGLVLFRDGRFQQARVGGAAYPATAGDICLDRRGRIWATTAEGLIRQQEGVIFETLPWKIQGSTYALTAGPWSGAVYAAGEHGIQAFQEDGGTRVWGPADGLPPKGPTLVMEDGQGRLWAGAGRVLVMKEPGAARFQDRSALLQASLSPNGQPFLDHDGSVWLPTQDGAQQLGGDRPGEHLGPARGLPFRWVRTVFRDREGSLWIVGAALAHMLGRGQVLNYPFSQGESGEMVWFTLRDGQGRMLAATDNGVMRMGPDGAARIPGTGGWRIKGMVLDRGGTLWMVNTRGPTLWLRPGRAAAEVAPMGDLGMCANSVWEDSRGRIWLGSTNRGVLRWDPAAARLVQEPVPLPASGLLGVYEIHEDGGGRIWAGADTGILVREPQGGWRLYADKACLRVRGMAMVPDGTAWIHTEEALGIAHVRLADGQIQILERRTRGWGLRSNMVYGVRIDPLGHIWVSTDKGLDRVEPALHVGRHDGMVSEDCSISALRIEGPVVWVGTSSGLVRFEDTGAAAPAGPPPTAHILELAYGDRRLEPPFGALPAVPSDQATLDFRVASPTYQDEQEIRYQVRLRGLEDVWRTLADRHVHFPALPGGSYRFEVRAARYLGPFGPVASLEFQVRPPWWRTWWAYAGVTLSAGMLLAGLVRIRVGALARSKAALEALVEVRTRELSLRNQELSEAMGNVKRLSGLLPICAHCKKIRDDRGYWNQLEQYFSEHAEVGFSHGICPDCATEIFPEITLKPPRT